MKNRKFIVVAFMLVACMVVGVGYAAVTDTFELEGHATISQENANEGFNQNVYFTGVYQGDALVSDVVDHSTYGYTASVNVANDSASYHVYSLEAHGDKQEIIFQIKNEGEVDAQICIDNKVETNSKNDVFTVTYWAKDSQGNWSKIVGHEDIKADGTIDIKVIVEVTGYISETVSADFKFQFYVVDDVNTHVHEGQGT